MSDFSALERSFALPAALPLMDEAVAYAEPLEATQVQPHEVVFRRLRSEHEIARILPLRDELQLTAARGDASFGTREKKETRRGSWVRSCVSASTSARFATFR